MTQRTQVTALDIKTRFPEFASIPDARISFAIEEAESWIGTGFDGSGSKDRVIGLRFLVAHALVMQGDGTSAIGATAGPVISESLGDASVTYLDQTGSASGGSAFSDLSRTFYGREYAKIARRNRGGPRIV